MVETFNDFLEEGIFDNIKILGQKLIRDKGPAFAQQLQDRFKASLGNQEAAGRLDTNAVLKDLQDSFRYYCGQQGLKTTAMAVVEFLSVIRGEEQLEYDDSWMKWLTGTPNIKIDAPDAKAINSQFRILVNKSTDDILTSKAVAKIQQLSAANEQNYELANNWMRMVSLSKPDILQMKTVGPILHLLDRDLDQQELTAFFTIVARDMLRTKAIRDMASPKSGTTGTRQDTPGEINTNPTTKRTNFSIPIGKPTITEPIASPSELMVEIRGMSTVVYGFLEDGKAFDNSQMTELVADIARQTRDIKVLSAISSRLLALLSARSSAPYITSMYEKFRQTRVTAPDGTSGFVVQLIPRENLVALVNWIDDGGTLDEVTAEFNATVDDFNESVATVAYLAGMLKAGSK